MLKLIFAVNVSNCNQKVLPKGSYFEDTNFSRYLGVEVRHGPASVNVGNIDLASIESLYEKWKYDFIRVLQSIQVTSPKPEVFQSFIDVLRTSMPKVLVISSEF